MSEAAVRANGIAVIGMACRFPGARNPDELWRNLRDGVESIHFFSDQELTAAGVSPQLLRDPAYVKARGVLEDADGFDAAFFGVLPREAEVMDPQHRVFLECAWAALEDAAQVPERLEGVVGVYAGAGLNTYLINNVSRNPAVLEAAGAFRTFIGNDKDFLPMWVSYKLDLKGPSVGVQTACSSSLVAVDLAMRSLRGHQCDLALAGGVTVAVPQTAGYLQQEGDSFSPDGHCRAFDAAARGTVFGNGCGVVVLKRLEDALADGDFVHAVLLGSAVNNDGAVKVGFTAPSIDGQAEVIALAQAVAGVDARSIGYLEAHGTGTALGDPIEVEALTEAFRLSTDERGFCALGSVKTNLGHLDVAAGIAGLIKTVLALRQREIPPSLHYSVPNPRIDFSASPFRVNAQLSEWSAAPGTPRRAGVSSFGFGGTNAHVIVEEAPASAPGRQARPTQLLVLSAKSSFGLATATEELERALRERPGLPLSDAAWTLQVGRRAFEHRRFVVCEGREQALEALVELDPGLTLTSVRPPRPVSPAFLLPGQGSQHPGMARGLYDSEPTFRGRFDRAAAVLAEHAGLDLLDLLFGSQDDEAAALPLQRTSVAQPALFAVETCLAALWEEWGVRPQALLGHSLGELTAASLAGVFSWEDGLRLVAERGRLMEEHGAGGAMLAVPLAAARIEERLPAELELAADNGPFECVVSGPSPAVADLAAALAGEGVETRRLDTSHAFHSAAMETAAARFRDHLAGVELRPPRVPFVSNLTGRWIRDDEATDPSYWARQMRSRVRFHEALATLLEDPDRILLEVGPGSVLTTLARRHPSRAGGQAVLHSLGRPGAGDRDPVVLLHALGSLWLAGHPPDWDGFHRHGGPRRVPLPTYPFERQRFWVEPAEQPVPAQEVEAAERQAPASIVKQPEIDDWLYLPSWRRAPAIGAEEPPNDGRPWLLFVDESGLGEALAARCAQGGAAVWTVRRGDEFAAAAERSLRIDPTSRADHLELLRALGGARPRIVHLWNVRGPEREGGAGVPAADTGPFYNLLFLLQALAAEQGATLPGSGLEVTVVADHLRPVTGNERTSPGRSMLLGPARVAVQELPGLRLRVVDVEPEAAQRPGDLELLLRELGGDGSELLVAHRGGHRWYECFDRLAAPPPAGPVLRDAGHVLISGGLGRFGLAVAEHLARHRRARLTLLGRHVPDDEREPQGAAADSRGAERRERLRHLRQVAEDVRLVEADVSDAQAVREAVSAAVAARGPVTGVVHAAGVMAMDSFQPLAEADIAGCERHFRPKVYGLSALDDALSAAGCEPDFALTASSLSPILGGIGLGAYAAANLYMDAWVERRRAQGVRRWTAVNWEGWAGLGMADDLRVGRELASLHMDDGEIGEVLERCVALGRLEPRLVAATGDLERRRKRWAGGGGASPPPPSSRPSPAPHPPSGTDEPEDLERRVMEVWSEVLGVAIPGPEADFFEIGGNSLVAIQIIARLRQVFEIDLPLQIFFQAPRVRELAQVIAERASGAAAPPDLTMERIRQMVEEIEAMSPRRVRAALAELAGGAPAAAPRPAAAGAVAPRAVPRPRADGGLELSLFFFSGDATAAPGERYRLLLDSARFADEQGFAAIWTPERHFQKFGGLYPNPSVLGGALATLTQRVGIRAGSVVLPLHDPVRVVEEWSVIDNLSGGRVAISFASGWHPGDFVLRPDAYDDRKERMFEGIETVRRLWAGDAVRLRAGDGQEVEVTTQPRPLRGELPVWVTCESTATWVRAAQIGGNVLTALILYSLDELTEKVRLYRQTRREAGLDPRTGRITVMLHTFVGDDAETVRAQVEEPMTRYLESFIGQNDKLLSKLVGVDAAQVTAEDRRSLITFAFERYFESASLLGTPESCRKVLDALVAIGVDEVACLVDFGVAPSEVLAGLPRLAALKDLYAGHPAAAVGEPVDA